MRTVRIHGPGPLLAALLLACGGDTPTDAYRASVEPRFSSSASAEWSAPVNLGPVVNSPATESNPTITADELTMYFASNRPGGLGGLDVWMTRRASRSSPWEPPVNLGAPVNTPFIDGAPALSPDGHLLFIHSNRTGTAGGNDIWMAHRSGSNDDIDWEAPVRLGPDVNTPDDEQGPEYTASDGGGALYFNRGNIALQRADLYRAEVKRGGRTDGPAQPVAELNDPTRNDAAPTVRADAREILFWSVRAGSLSADIWQSTRQSANHPWSPPRNAAALNSPVLELHPELSQDARTLYLASNRPGGAGNEDIYMSTRAGSPKQ